MRLPVKPVIESLGTDITKTGGSESLGPPPGGIILAQPALAIAITVIIKILNPYRNDEKNFFIICLLHANLVAIIRYNIVFK
jgi:hypothetical protein